MSKHLINFKKIVCFVVLIISMALIPKADVHAETITQVDDFNGLHDDLQFLGDSYRKNYYLDIEECGLLDAGYLLLNSIANGFFYFMHLFAYLVVTLFYHALTLDVGVLFYEQIDNIQSALNASIFQPLLLIALIGSAITVIRRFFQQNMIGIVSEAVKVIFLMFCAVMLTTNSRAAISTINGLTKEVSLSAINNINGNTSDSSFNLNSYAVQTAGLLWKDLLHDPWLSLEFGDSSDAGLAAEILSSAPGSEARAGIIESHKELFPKESAVKRLGNSLLFIFIILIKGLLFLIMALMMFAVQFITIFYFLMAIIILFLAFLPSYSSIVGIWFKKLLESQIAVFLMAVILGLVVKIDGILASFAVQFGWLPVLVFQIAVAVVLFLSGNKILYTLGNIQHATKHFVQNTIHSGKHGQHTLKRFSDNLDNMATSAQRAKDYLGAKASTVKTGNQDIYRRTYTDYAGGKRPNLENSIVQTTLAANERASQQKISKKILSDDVNYKQIASSNGKTIRTGSSNNIISVDFNAAEAASSRTYMRAAANADTPGNPVKNNVMNTNEIDMKTTNRADMITDSAVPRPVLNASADNTPGTAAVAASAPPDSPIASSSAKNNNIAAKADIPATPVADSKIEKPVSQNHAPALPAAPAENYNTIKPVKPRSGTFTAIEVHIPASADKTPKKRPKTDSRAYAEPSDKKENQKRKISPPDVASKKV